MFEGESPGTAGAEGSPVYDEGKQGCGTLFPALLMEDEQGPAAVTAAWR